MLIDSTDGERAWTTIGVSENIIEASWQALADSIVYGLLHTGPKVRRRWPLREYVPVKPDRRRPRSTPRRRGAASSWIAGPPAELARPASRRADRLGSPGPDQGYALSWPRASGTAWRSTRRAAPTTPWPAASRWPSSGRRCSAGPRSSTTCTVAFTLWGFLDEQADDELVTLRRRLFEEVANTHHYVEQRRIADLVPGPTLRLTPVEVKDRHATDWRSLLTLD